MGNARIRRRVFQVGHACVPHLKIALSVVQCGTDHLAKLIIHD